jgi:hypothetical protein
VNRLTNLAAILAISAIAATEAGAQWNVARFDDQQRQQRAYTTFGLDPAFVSSVGFAQVVRPFDHAVQLTGEAGVAAAKMDARDWRVRLGGQSSLARWRSVHLTGSAAFVARGTENSIYRGVNFGADVGGTLGVYRPRWFVAGEAGKDKAIVTHIAHTTWYRNYFYPDAKDGWYVDAGGTVRYGAQAGVSLGRAELVARIGRQRTEHWGKTAAPIYGSVGVGFGL